jgi:phage-related protein
MSTTDDMQRMAEKYAEELRRLAKDASKEFERAANEIEKLGSRMAHDVRTGIKDGGVDLDTVKQRTVEEVNRAVPAMAADLKEMERRINERADKLQNDIRRMFK